MDERFVGRPTEMTFLRERLQEARRGAPRVVLLEGEAGVGKTALLREFLAGADHLRVLWASGEELEVGLAFGVMGQLVVDIATPPSAQLTTLGLQGGDADPLQVGMGIIDLLRGLQATGLVVLAVDDLHWVDLPSLQALVLALRRLRTERVLALLSVRDDRKELLPASLHRLVAGTAGAHLRLGGLSIDELRMFGRTSGAGRLSRRAAVRLHQHTDGNPRHARALLEELPADVLCQNAQPLPAPRAFRALVLARRAACSPDAERLVEAAAVLGDRCPLVLAASLAILDDPLVVLEQAIAAGLLEERPTATTLVIAFPHPLIRAAVYHNLGPAQRAALHARAARLTERELASLRHRVAAAGGSDPALATEVAGLARRQAGAGVWTAAADSLLTAARLAGTPAERERLTLEAVDHLLLGGSAAEAAAFTEEVATFADAARRDYVLARLVGVRGRHADAERLLLDALAQCDLGDDRELAANIRGQLALHSLVRASGRQAVAWARRALAPKPPGPSERGNLLDILTIGLVISGRIPEALKGTARLQNPTSSSAHSGLDGWVGRGVARMWSDDLVGAHRDLTAALAAYQQHRAPLPWGLIGRAILAEVDYRLGAWDDANQHAEQAVSLAEDSDEVWLMPFVHAVAAFPLAARGARESAMAHAAAAARHLREVDAESGTAWVAAAQALVALADGDNQRVVAALEPLQRLPAGTALDEPGWHPWRALCTEALAGLGCWAEADAVLAPLEAIAAARGLRSALAAASRARGTLEAARGHTDQAELAFRAGLEHVAVLEAPFDHALLELAYGRFLRRAGRHRDAARQLEAARRRLARLDARPYLKRCHRELAGCDHAPSRNGAGLRSTLTQQELAVARLVAAGCTNRQAAAELVVSVKTIEYHLGNAYAKFGVTSRTQLVLAMGQD
jgi:DNA-binding NarL/FixJ family response regulator